MTLHPTTTAEGCLPLLCQATAGGVPNVEQVMKHAVVLNDWKAELFEHFLRRQDGLDDLRRMLAATTTAVVIGGCVRPLPAEKRCI